MAVYSNNNERKVAVFPCEKSSRHDIKQKLDLHSLYIDNYCWANELKTLSGNIADSNDNAEQSEGKMNDDEYDASQLTELKVEGSVDQANFSGMLQITRS